MTATGRPELDAGSDAPRESAGRTSISIVTPAYNEEANLPALHERLGTVMDGLGLEWEWIVVDDHSRDATFAVLEALARRDVRVRGLRFSRNFGSHTAIACGLHHAEGGCAIVICADLQDPPEIIPDLLAAWRGGAHVVWAVRDRREGVGLLYRALARLYYALLRSTGALADTPAGGADFFLLDRRVLEAFNGFRESNVSIPALITWMGFRQSHLPYDRRERLAGRSGWSLSKRLKLIADSVTSFTYFPIRLMSYVGFTTAVLGFLYAGLVVYNALRGDPPEGWAALMSVLLVVGGIQMIMLGVLGEYLWRALDESRRRPRYLIESRVDGERGHEAGRPPARGQAPPRSAAPPAGRG